MKVFYPFIFLILLTSCSLQYMHRQRCPAYVDNFIPHGTYDPNHIECSVWYEWLDSFWWYTTDKTDALELWAEISKRPMYFNMTQEFRFSVKADDGYTYHFWSMAQARDTLYNITVQSTSLCVPIWHFMSC